MFVFSVCCLVSRQCHMISSIVGSNDSSVLVSSSLTLSPSALLPLTRLKSLRGGADTPLAYKILCVRFTCVVHDGSSILSKASLSATGVTLDTGGWLALTRNHPDPSPDRDFHPARSAKLRLAHITVGRPVTRPPPYRSRRADFPHRAPRSDSLCTWRHRLTLRSCDRCVVARA